MDAEDSETPSYARNMARDWSKSQFDDALDDDQDTRHSTFLDEASLSASLRIADHRIVESSSIDLVSWDESSSGPTESNYLPIFSGHPTKEQSSQRRTIVSRTPSSSALSANENGSSVVSSQQSILSDLLERSYRRRSPPSRVPDPPSRGEVILREDSIELTTQHASLHSDIYDILPHLRHLKVSNSVAHGEPQGIVVDDDAPVAADPPEDVRARYQLFAQPNKRDAPDPPEHSIAAHMKEKPVRMPNNIATQQRSVEKFVSPLLVQKQPLQDWESEHTDDVFEATMSRLKDRAPKAQEAPPRRVPQGASPCRTARDVVQEEAPPHRVVKELPQSATDPSENAEVAGESSSSGSESVAASAPNETQFKVASTPPSPPFSHLMSKGSQRENNSQTQESDFSYIRRLANGSAGEAKHQSRDEPSESCADFSEETDSQSFQDLKEDTRQVAALPKFVRQSSNISQEPAGHHEDESVYYGDENHGGDESWSGSETDKESNSDTYEGPDEDAPPAAAAAPMFVRQNSHISQEPVGHHGDESVYYSSDKEDSDDGSEESGSGTCEDLEEDFRRSFVTQAFTRQNSHMSQEPEGHVDDQSIYYRDDDEGGGEDCSGPRSAQDEEEPTGPHVRGVSYEDGGHSDQSGSGTYEDSGHYDQSGSGTYEDSGHYDHSGSYMDTGSYEEGNGAYEDVEGNDTCEEGSGTYEERVDQSGSYEDGAGSGTYDEDEGGATYDDEQDDDSGSYSEAQSRFSRIENADDVDDATLISELEDTMARGLNLSVLSSKMSKQPVSPSKSVFGRTDMPEPRKNGPLGLGRLSLAQKEMVNKYLQMQDTLPVEAIDQVMRGDYVGREVYQAVMFELINHSMRSVSASESNNDAL